MLGTEGREPVGVACEWCERTIVPAPLGLRYHWPCLKERNAALRAEAQVARTHAREVRARAVKASDEFRRIVRAGPG